MIEEIRAKAQEILENNTVDLVIGYEIGMRGTVHPAFIYSAADTDRLVWNRACTHNLVSYLRYKRVPASRSDPPPKIGLVLKACDARALNVLLLEKQVPRDDLYLIGVVCDGMNEQAGLVGQMKDAAQMRCQTCTERVPVFYDVLIGEAPGSATGDGSTPTQAELEMELELLEAMSTEERRAFWDAEFALCLRCYACRQACPACYCVECTAELVDPEWVSIAIDTPEKSFFHIMRAYHLAGRCVGCDECARVCPVDVRLDLLNAWMRREVQRTFGFEAGVDATTPAPLATFRPDENLKL